MERVPLRRRVAWIVFAVAGIAATAVYGAFPDPDHRWVFPLFGLGGAMAVLVGVRVNRPTNVACWIEVSAGIAFLALGDLTYSALEHANGGMAPFPSVADAVYMLGYAVLAVGLACVAGSRRGGHDTAAILDGLIIAGAVGVVAWVAFMSRIVADARLDLDVAVALAYPFMDLVLLAMAVRLALAPTASGIGRHLLVIGVIAYLCSDFTYTFQSLEGTYSLGSVVDVGWMCGYILFGAAALHPRMIQRVQHVETAADPHRSTWRVIGLGVATLIPLTLLWVPGVSATPEKLYGVAITSMAITLGVLVRIADLFRELSRSIVQRRRLEGRLRDAADHDPLVGLWNRRVFHEHLADLLGRGETGFAALFIDVDDFKRINDDFGHAAGDAVLTEVARRIEDAVRPSDLAARLGGDEFGVLLMDGVDRAAADVIAARMLDRIVDPIRTGDDVIAISVSVGVAQADGATDAEALMRRADIAMYQAKERGKGRVETYVETRLDEPIPIDGPRRLTSGRQLA